KQRRDAVELFRKGGRDDLADEEEAQIELLQPYLPAQLSASDLQQLVTDTAEAVGAMSPKDMGKLMQALRQVTAGRAEGAAVSRLAREELALRAARADGPQ